MNQACHFCDPSTPPPGDARMDMSVISCMMQAPASAVDAAAQILKPDDFLTEACGLLFDVITRQYSAGEPVEPVAIMGYLYEKGLIEKLGGPAFVSECYTAATSPENVKFYAAAVLDASKRRQMAHIASEMARVAVLGDSAATDGGWREAMMPLMRRADAALMDGQADELIPLKQVAFQYSDHCDNNTLKGVDAAVPTGIKGVDEIMEGGIRREYILIGGRQGHGKTLLAMQFAGVLANAGRRGLVIGYEMTALQILMRDIARESRTPLSHVMGRVPFEGMEIQTVTRSIARLMEGWDVHYTQSPYITLESVAAHARTLHRHKPLDFLVIDYLQLIPRKGGKERSDEILVTLSNQVERLRKELGCTLIAPVQLQDQGLIRDARGILDAPQVFIRIEMEELDGEDGCKESGDNGTLKFMKNRFGSSNRSCPVYRNGTYQAFEDREPQRRTESAKPSRRTTRQWQP